MSAIRDQRYQGDVATRITPSAWAAARAALSVTCDRFAALVAGADPQAMATADWTVMDTAAHVAVIAWLNTARMVSDSNPLPISGASDGILNTTVDNIHGGLNAQLLRDYPEREPEAVLGKLRACIDEILRLTADDDPARTSSWLGGSRLPMAGFVAHLTNEMLIHGHDIARGIDAPWRIPQQDAARFFDLFLVEIIRHGVGTVLDDARPVRPGRIAVEFRSAYTAPVTVALQDGQVWIEDPGRDNDVRVYFEPAALDLVLFHRVTRSKAAMTGALRVWGRRPWLLMPFLKKVRLP